MLLKGFEIQSHQTTAHYLWPFRNGGLTYDALGQIDPPSPGIGLEYDLSEQKIQNIWHVYANNSKLISKSKIFYS